MYAHCSSNRSPSERRGRAIATTSALLLFWTLLPACTVDLVPIECVEDDDCLNAGEACLEGLCQQTGEPSIEIISPSDGVLNSNSTIVEVQVSNFTLDPEAIGGTPVDGHGHWHYYVDGTYLGVSGDEETAITRLPVGTNEVEVRLASNDHREIAGASDTVEIDVTAESRALLITQPEVGDDRTATVSADDVLQVEFTVRNFEMAPDQIGGDPDPCLCRGHIHVYIDGAYQRAIAVSPFEIDLSNLASSGTSSLDVGPHVLELRMAENDHTEISPPVFDIITLDVTE